MESTEPYDPFTALPTPPDSENGGLEHKKQNLEQRTFDEGQKENHASESVDTNLKHEDNEAEAETDSKDQDDDSNENQSNIQAEGNGNNDITNTSTEASNSGKKRRGRPKKIDVDSLLDKPTKAKKAKTESTPSSDIKPKNEDGDSSTATEEPSKKKAATAKPRAKASSSSESSGGYTKEQDAYLRQLYTGSTKLSLKEISEQFEQKFNTGRSKDALKFRWYKLKDEALVLTPKEEEILKESIKTYENDKYATILAIYQKKGGEGVAKLTERYIAKKMKEQDFATVTAGGGGEEDTKDG